MVLLAVVATALASSGCGPDIGFNADLRGNISPGKLYTEVQNWRTFGDNELYNSGKLFDDKTGRFKTTVDGYFLCSTQIRLDGAATQDYFRLFIALNGEKNYNNGLHTIEGNGKSSNYRTLTVSGNLHLKKGQYVSVWVFNSGDPKYTIQTESGFSCHRFASNIGFHADKYFTQKNGLGWKTITSWRTTGKTGLYSVGGGFNGGTGKFAAPTPGAYYCAVNARLDQASNQGYFRLVLAINGQIDINNGMHSISGNGGSTNYRSMAVAGSILLSKGMTVVVSVYSSKDAAYSFNTESGWGCHYMKHKMGFHADAKKSQKFKQGWNLVSQWEDRTSVNSELYSVGGSIANNGYYHAPMTGYYACSAQVRLDSASKNSYFRLIIALNGDRDINQGLHAIQGNGGSTNYRSMRVAGTVHLNKGQTVSVWVYSQNDKSFYMQSESGFSCHMFYSTVCTAHACNVVNGGFEKGNKLPAIGYKYVTPSGWTSKGTVVIKNRNGPWGKLPAFAGLYYLGIQFGGSFLEQTLKGLVPGEQYAIKFAAANRPGYGDSESFRILLDGRPILAATHPGKSWELHLLRFVAKSSTAKLRFENNSPKGDSTVFIDSVEGVGAHVCDNHKWTTEGGRCYRFYPQDGLDYRQMQAKCVQAGGELARIDNAKQNALVHKLAGKSRAFIGLTDAAVEGHFMWADGTAPTYTNWSPGEPNNYKPLGGEDCAEINWTSDGKWNDAKCVSNNYSEGYVCSAVVDAATIATKPHHGPDTSSKCYPGYSFCPKKNCCDMNSDCTCDEICNKGAKLFRKNVGCSYSIATVVKKQCPESGVSAIKAKASTNGKGWHEVNLWKARGYNGLYNAGNHFDANNGRFNAVKDGYFLCSTQLRLDAAANNGYFRALIAVNGHVDVNNGLAVIDGNGGSTNYRTLGVSGLLRLNRAQHASVYVYSSSDNSYTVMLESGFSCHRLSGGVGFHADKNGDQTLKRGWAEITNWRTSGSLGLYAVGPGNFVKNLRSKGRFYVPKGRGGAYYCFAQLRLDATSSVGYFRLFLSTNGHNDYNEGLSVIRGTGGTTNYGSLGVAGSIYLTPGVFISAHVYSSSDNSYRVQSESGFGCHFLNSRIGFNADAQGNQRFSKGWARVSSWDTNPKRDSGLYSLGGSVAKNGYYHVPSTGYYACSTQLRMDLADKKSYFRLVIALNGDRSWRGGLHAIQGNGGQQNYRSIRVAGTLQLNKGSTVSVWIYSQSDASYYVQSESGFSCQKLTPAKCSAGKAKATTVAAKPTKPQKPCQVPNGANADLRKNIPGRRGWTQAKNWKSSGNGYLYNAGGSLDEQTGRFTARTDGYFFCAAQARLDGASSSSIFRMLIAINNRRDTNNGLHVIDGNGGTGLRTMSVAGTIELKKGQYVSMWIYSSGDQYTVQSETGFSCHRFTTTVGFHADKTANLDVKKKGWQEVTRWRTRGVAGLYNTASFNVDTGRFTTPKTAVYFCFAQLRIDGASSKTKGSFRLLLALNGQRDIHNGFQDIQGNAASSNTRSMSVAGTIYLQSGSYMTVNVYSDKDPSYRIQSESGWGCHMLRTRVGFHAHLKSDRKGGRGWNTVIGWVDSNRGKGDEELYAMTAGISGDGFYKVPRTGYYVCAAQLRVDSASKTSYFRAVVSLNGNYNVNNGALHSIDGSGGSTDRRTMKMAGTLHLKKGSTLSVHVYSQADAYFRIQRESGFSCHMFAVPTCKDHSTDIATAMPAPCEPDIGSNADLAVSSIAARRGWIEVRKWRTSGDAALYDAGGNLNLKTGRFTAHYNGYYLCSTQVRLDGAASSSYFRAVIAINGNRNGNNGLGTIDGNGGSTNARTLSVTGTIQLKKGQHASVYVFSSGDSYKIQSESGFSCHRFSTEIGFHADKTSDLTSKKVGWQTITRWRVSGQPGLYSVGGGFNLDTGRFTAPKRAVYYCYAHIRVDGASTVKGSYFRLLLALNNQKDVYNGFGAIGGNHESSNYRSMGVAGTIYLQSGNFMTVNVYANKDPSYRVQTESGWGCHQMNSRYGFHANAKTNQRLGRGWTSLRNWGLNPHVKGDEELYYMGGGFGGDGFYQVRATGYYACAVNARVDQANSDSIFRLILSINGNPDVNQGLHAISGNGGSTSYRNMKVAGTIHLKKGQTLSVSMYSSGDSYYNFQRESGFSCQMFGVCKGQKPKTTHKPATKMPLIRAKAGKRCGTDICKGGASRCQKCADGLQCLTYNSASQYGTCTPTSCVTCVKAKAYWLDGGCRFGKTGNKRALKTLKDCQKNWAAQNTAHCPNYQDCRKCITASKSLCGWAGDATFGSCGPYNADSIFGKVKLDAKQCGGTVVVHG